LLVFTNSQRNPRQRIGAGHSILTSQKQANVGHLSFSILPQSCLDRKNGSAEALPPEQKQV
jgi:hypothetical protein